MDVVSGQEQYDAETVTVAVVIDDAATGAFALGARDVVEAIAGRRVGDGAALFTATRREAAHIAGLIAGETAANGSLLLASKMTFLGIVEASFDDEILETATAIWEPCANDSAFKTPQAALVAATLLVSRDAR